jgi:hypothetical protein
MVGTRDLVGTELGARDGLQSGCPVPKLLDRDEAVAVPVDGKSRVLNELVFCFGRDCTAYDCWLRRFGLGCLFGGAP